MSRIPQVSVQIVQDRKVLLEYGRGPKFLMVDVVPDKGSPVEDEAMRALALIIEGCKQDFVPFQTYERNLASARGENRPDFLKVPPRYKKKLEDIIITATAYLALEDVLKPTKIRAKKTSERRRVVH